MTVVKILIGLVGLGVVIFVHELGHLIAAKLVGIEVEAFSLGWGRKLVGFTWRGTEYRVSVFPVGGYCKMKGERSYTRALDENLNEIPREPGTFFAAPPWKRIIALAAGPLANFVFAVLLLWIVWFAGFETESFPPRIVLASEYGVLGPDGVNPADTAGLQSGDVILSLGGRDVQSYADVTEIVAQNALTPLDMVVDRGGLVYSMSITPALDRESGAGYIGVYGWVEPVVKTVTAGSPADEGGVLPGDRIVAVNGESVSHSVDISSALSDASYPVTVGVVRDGAALSLTLPWTDLVADSESVILGVGFQTIHIPSPDLSVFGALEKAITESFRYLVVSIRGLRLLFRGVEITSAVAGPVRIVDFIGSVATSGFAIGFGTGLLSLSSFLAAISVILFFMNLLPIPVLDGGQIVLATLEWIRGRGPRPKAVYRYQIVGGLVIFGILVVALFGDVLYLIGR